MNEKEQKEKLKAARDFIKDKRFNESLSLSKEILEVSHDNYNALVFQGAAYDGLHQMEPALGAYRIAAKLDAQQPLAWQGICSIYEKSLNVVESPSTTLSLSEVSTAYETLIRLLTSNEKKCCELSIKLCRVYLEMSCPLEAVETCERIMNLASFAELDQALKLSTNRVLALAIPQISDLNESRLLLFEKTSRLLFNLTLEVNDRKLLWKNYIDYFIKKGADSESIWRMCEESVMQLKPVDAIYPHSLMCRIYLDSLAENRWKFEKICPVVELLTSTDPTNPWLTLVEGHRKLLAGDLELSRTLLSQGLEIEPTSIGGVVCYVQCLIRLHCYHETLTSVSNGLKLVSNNAVLYYGDRRKATTCFKLCEARALLFDSSSDCWNKAVNISLELLDVDSELVDAGFVAAQALVQLSQLDRADQVISDLERKTTESVETLTVRGLWFYANQNFTEAKQRLEKAIELDRGLTSMLAHHYLGLIYWHQLAAGQLTLAADTRPATTDTTPLTAAADIAADRPTAADVDTEAVTDCCIKCFIQAAKLDPYFSCNFLRLGDCYRLTNDTEKAKRCYQKAFDLDPDNEKAGSCLIDSLVQLGDQAAALKYLKQITTKTTSGKWAWLRLGLHQMRTDDITSAISSLQTALRRDAKDAQCWECLGEAYMKRGSYTAALKAFTRATELNPDDAIFSYFQLAAIKQKLYLFPEAISLYSAILSKNPYYIPALKGYSESHICLSRSALSQCLYGSAVDHCQIAINSLTRAVKQRPDLSCLWKCLGDAFTILHVVPTQLLDLSVPPDLINSPSTEESVADVKLNKKDLLAVGSRCYGTALKLHPQLAGLWYDLGVNYYHQMKVVDRVMSRVVAEKSLEALKRSVKLDPVVHSHWTALGVIAASKEISDPALAQHCFIKSINAEPDNALAWTNLGILYLSNGEAKLAHDAFAAAQSLDPECIGGWIGQALVAESVADDDTMDLFRHSTELGSHPEALIGYSHWVCTTLLDQSKISTSWCRYAIDNLNAVCTASDAMAKYTDSIPDDAIGWNTYGLLLERQKLHNLSVYAFDRSVKLFEAVSDGKKMLNAIRENLARLLTKCGRYADALLQYESLIKAHIMSSDSASSEGGSSFELLCGYALTLSMANKFAESLQVYERCLTLAHHDKMKCLVQVARGLTAFKAGDMDLAKSLLFLSVKMPCCESLQVFLWFAVARKDVVLVTALIKELKKISLSDDLLSSTDLVYLLAQARLVQGNRRAARNEHLRLVHSCPSMTTNWTNLASFLLDNEPEIVSSSDVVIGCCHRALQASGSAQAYLEALRCLSRSMLATPFGDTMTGFRVAQKAVHLTPDDLSSWCLLLSAAHAQYTESVASGQTSEDLEKFVLTLPPQLMARVEADMTRCVGDKSTLQALHQWCARQYAIALVTANKCETALVFVNQASWLYDTDLFFSTLIAYLTKDEEAITTLTLQQQQQQEHAIAIQALLLMHINGGRSNEAQTFYQRWRQISELNVKKKLRTQIKISLLTLHHLENNTAAVKELLDEVRNENDELVQKMFADIGSS